MITGDFIGPDREVVALVALYDEAVHQIEASLGTALRSFALGTAMFRLTRLKLARQILEQLSHETAPQARRVVVAAYRAGMAAADAAVDEQGEPAPGPPIGASFGSIVHEEAVAELARALISHLEPAEVEVGRRIRDVYQKIGVEHVAEGLIAGAPTAQVAKGIKDDLLHEGVTGFVDRAGRRWTLDNYSAMVARTTSREAVTHGLMNRMRDRLESGVALDDLVTVSSHPHPVDICTPYDGRTFSLFGRTPGYPKAEMLPPFHPRCKHVLTPARASLEALERALGLSPTSPPGVVSEPPSPAQAEAEAPGPVPAQEAPTAGRLAVVPPQRPTPMEQRTPSGTYVISEEQARGWVEGSAITYPLYHGSHFVAKIRREGFDLGAPSSTGNRGYMGEGVYLSPDRDTAASYAPELREGVPDPKGILKVYVRVRRLMDEAELEALIDERKFVPWATRDEEEAGVFGPTALRRAVEARGYDGVQGDLLHPEDIEPEIVVFDPANVAIVGP